MLIIFDLDDTLIDTWNTHFPYKIGLVAEKIVELGIISDKDAVFQKIMEVNNTTVNGTEAINKCLDSWDVTDNNLREEIIDVYYDPAKTQEIPILEGAVEMLQWAFQHHTLAIVTQGREPEQLSKFPSAHLDQKLFSKVIVTPYFNKGLCYGELCGELNVLPEETIVIGDKYKTDLLPAKELGMKTVHMQWGRGKIILPKKGEIDYSITHLSELKQIIENL